MTIAGEMGGAVSLIGSEGLGNAAAVLGVYLLGLAVMTGAAVYGGVKSIVYGVRLARIYRQGGEIKEAFSAYFGKSLPALTVIFGIILIGVGGASFAAGADSGGPFYIHMSKISGNSGMGGNYSLLWNIFGDMAEGKTKCYTVNEGYSIDFGGQELAYFGYEDEDMWSPEMVTAQIGSGDRVQIKNNLPGNVNAAVEVYERSGFIKSIVCERDLSVYEGYTYLYNIYIEDDMIVYSFEGSGTEPGNLSWCGFRSGESGDIHNSLFMFGTSGDRAAPELDTAKALCNEVCLYAWVDGGYKAVSNTLYVNDPE